MALKIKIKGQNFEFFNEFNLNLKYNSIASTFSIAGVFDELNINQKNLFKPLQFNNVDVYYDNEKLITGTILTNSSSIENKETVYSLAGYSKTGILEDCQIPLSEFPLQFDNLTLKEIIEKLIRPFKLKLIVDNSIRDLANKIYEKTTAEVNQTIKVYLTDLASQRGLILSHDNNGNLLLTKPQINKQSISTYDENVPATKISLVVNGQRLHSVITVLRQASFDVDVPGEEFVNNTLITQFRPTTIEQTSGQNDQILNFAKNIRGSELRNIKLTIETDRWKWYDGKRLHLITPNNIIDVISPSNYIPKRKSFFVEEVNIKGTSEGEKAIIKCVIPESFNNEQPTKFIA